MGLFSTKGVAKSTLLLIAQPILTIWFHKFCKGRFESAFMKLSLQVSDNQRNGECNVKFSFVKYWFAACL